MNTDIKQRIQQRLDREKLSRDKESFQYAKDEKTAIELFDKIKDNVNIHTLSTVFNSAASGGWINLMDIMIQNGYRVNKDKCFAIRCAIQNDNIASVKYLISKGSLTKIHRVFNAVNLAKNYNSKQCYSYLSRCKKMMAVNLDDL